MKQYVLTLHLKDDKDLIQEYIKHHQNVWKEVEDSMKAAGILSMEIFLHGITLFMIMNVNDSFTFEKKALLDQHNAKVQEWETLMWKFQTSVKGAKEGEKWVIMDKIYTYNNA